MPDDAIRPAATASAAATAMPALSRRGFLTGAGALVIGFSLPLPTARRAAAATPGSDAVWQAPEGAQLNAWLRIGADGSITVITGRSEMGQGPTTALPQILAEELRVPFERVAFAMAPVAQSYNNPLFGAMITGGSTSVKGEFEQLRKAGAAAREMLRQAAAARWDVPVEEVEARDGVVRHAASGQSASYGALAEDAAALKVPQDPPLTDRADWTLIGTPQKRLDTRAKSTGQATFGIDVQVPDMLHGAVINAPFGATLKSVDPKPALDRAGVAQVVDLDDAVIVLADTWWTADQAAKALSPEWQGVAGDLDNAKVRETLAAGLDASDPAEAQREGDPDAALGQAARTIESTYAVPYLAHATMEPMTATASVTDGKAELWLPTQAQTWTAGGVAKALGLKPDDVTLHTTFLGGGFGRRAEQDFALQAAKASRAAGRPVKLVWSREQDTRHDFYRPAAMVRFTVGVDEAGMPVAWKTQVSAPSIAARMMPQMIKDGVDPFAVEGLAEMPYRIPARATLYHMAELPVPVGFWRSVGHSQNGFFQEAMIDELARAAGMDPLEYRRALLPEGNRHRRALDAVAEMIGWSAPPAEGRSRGIAVHESFGSIVAEAVEASVDGEKRVTLHRVAACVDCGTAVNPNIIEQQIESAIVYGLSAALWGGVTLENGRVQEGNFDRLQVLRMRHMPEIETRIIAEGDADMGGIGEPGLPPAAPALVAALRRATGEPLRTLPLSEAGFSFG